MSEIKVFGRTVRITAFALIAVFSLVAGAAQAECSAKVNGTLTNKEMKKMAKVSMADAQATALKLIGKADLKKVMSRELEVEENCLVYSFDLQLKSAEGSEEIMIDAVSGQVISQKHETPEQEAQEKEADKKGDANKK
ncbi:PepSY domain-containing protein [Undibacterium sp. Ji50W]|uniref:PepSY domain-containing protein n=1 Tax=Undibacterium sp. Ji50W TaxID=3413041 RepID=UPI003BF075E9